MIKAIWDLAKIGIIVLAVIWLSERPGAVSIEWMDYKLNIAFGLFVVILLGLMMLAMFIFGFIKALVDTPDMIRKSNEIKRKEKGYKALTLGLTAVAAGDAKIAAYQAHRARKFLHDDAGLPVLLDAQASRLQGREEDARENFKALAANQDTSFLGVRGLLQSALDNKDYEMAYELAGRANLKRQKQPWILKILYDLEIKMQKWDAARLTLKKLENLRVIHAEKANSDRVAMLMAEAEDSDDSKAKTKWKGANSLDKSFVPVVIKLVGSLVEEEQQSKAKSLIEKTWKINPHPLLLKLWDEVKPEKAKDKPLENMRWYEKLLKANDQGAALHIKLAEIATAQGLWAEAESYLDKAEELEISKSLFEAQVELAKAKADPEDDIQSWQKCVQEAPPEKAWVCKETGLIYEEWQAIAEPHGAFNSMHWDYPATVVSAPQQIISSEQETTKDLLEAPKKERKQRKKVKGENVQRLKDITDMLE